MTDDLSRKVLEKVKNQEANDGCQNHVAEDLGPLVVAFYVHISPVLAAHTTRLEDFHKLDNQVGQYAKTNQIAKNPSPCIVKLNRHHFHN